MPLSFRNEIQPTKFNEYFLVLKFLFSLPLLPLFYSMVLPCSYLLIKCLHPKCIILLSIVSETLAPKARGHFNSAAWEIAQGESV